MNHSLCRLYHYTGVPGDVAMHYVMAQQWADVTSQG